MTHAGEGGASGLEGAFHAVEHVDASIAEPATDFTGDHAADQALEARDQAEPALDLAHAREEFFDRAREELDAAARDEALEAALKKAEFFFDLEEKQREAARGAGQKGGEATLEDAYEAWVAGSLIPFIH